MKDKGPYSHPSFPVKGNRVIAIEYFGGDNYIAAADSLMINTLFSYTAVCHCPVFTLRNCKGSILKQIFHLQYFNFCTFGKHTSALQC